MKSETRGRTSAATVLEIRGEDFVLLPRAEYDRLRGVPSDAVDAVTFGSTSLGKSLRLARVRAGLTQAALAQKLRRSQALVSSAETGAARVGQRYVRAVLAACGLPEDWSPRAPRTPGTEKKSSASASRPKTRR